MRHGGASNPRPKTPRHTRQSALYRAGYARVLCTVPDSPRAAPEVDFGPWFEAGSLTLRAVRSDLVECVVVPRAVAQECAADVQRRVAFRRQDERHEQSAHAFVPSV